MYYSKFDINGGSQNKASAMWIKDGFYAQLHSSEEELIMGPDLKELKDILNNRLFCYEVLEFRSGEGEMDRLAVKKECLNRHFMKTHFFDDLFTLGVNNGLFTETCKKLVNDLALESGINIKFMYSQCIVMDEVRNERIK